MAVRAVMVGVGNTALENSARLLHDEAMYRHRDLDVALLTGDGATRDAARDAIIGMAKATRRNDILIVAFSAHAATGVGQHREWISLADTAISDLELSRAISHVAFGARVVLIADACKILGIGDDNAVTVHHILLRRYSDEEPLVHRLPRPVEFAMPSSEHDLADPGPDGLVRVPLLDLDYMLLEMPASTQEGTTSSDATCTLRGSAETVTCSAYMASLIRALRHPALPSYLQAHEQVRRELGVGTPNARLYTPHGLRNYQGDTFVTVPFFSAPEFPVPPFSLPLLAD